MHYPVGLKGIHCKHHNRYKIIPRAASIRCTAKTCVVRGSLIRYPGWYFKLSYGHNTGAWLVPGGLRVGRTAHLRTSRELRELQPNRSEAGMSCRIMVITKFSPSRLSGRLVRVVDVFLKLIICSFFFPTPLPDRHEDGVELLRNSLILRVASH